MPQDAAKFGHLLRAVYERPWAIVEEALHELVATLTLAASGQIGREEFEAMLAARTLARPNLPQTVDIARIPIRGHISQGQGLLGLLLGGTSVDQITAEFSAAMQNETIAGVILDINSPGGTVDGVEELATLIRGSRGRKPIVAVANGSAESAAYWLASAADEVVVTPSGSVGSIGIFTVHEDVSAMLEADGVKPTIISYGKFKTEGNPFEPLSDEARGQIQSRVDHFGHMFEAAVAKGRGVPVETVRSTYGQGRSKVAGEALSAGMVDRIDTLDNTIRRVARGVFTRPAALAPAADSIALQADPVPGMPFSERLALVSAGARDLVEHATARADMKARDGRELTSRDRSGLRAVADSLRALAETAGVEEETEPKPSNPAWRNHARIQLALVRAQDLELKGTISNG